MTNLRLTTDSRSRSDGLTLSCALDRALDAYDYVHSAWGVSRRADTLVFSCPSVAAHASISSLVFRLQGAGFQVDQPDHDTLIVDLMACPSDASPSGRLKLVDAIIEHRRQRLLGDSKLRGRATELAERGRSALLRRTWGALRQELDRK